MQELILAGKLKENIQKFIQGLISIYRDDLVSVILYGSGASGEFIESYSNLNILVVLRNTGLENLKAVSDLVNKFKVITPLFFTENYINTSAGIFPIEFLDMQENYFVLYGKDVLKDIKIDIKNLRFQCEHELKGKLIDLKQAYLTKRRDRAVLQGLLFKTFTSVLHILRNVLRLKGRKNPPYRKEDILEDISSEFQLDLKIWGEIWAAKNKKIKLSRLDVEDLFVDFVNELEKIADSTAAF